jgi:hypothetical protein
MGYTGYPHVKDSWGVCLSGGGKRAPLGARPEVAAAAASCRRAAPRPGGARTLPGRARLLAGRPWQAAEPLRRVQIAASGQLARGWG